MKKIYLSLCVLAIACTSFAQAIDNAGMETWRSGMADTVTVTAPTSWYGLDSTIIALGASAGIALHPQVFQSTTVKNTGTSSAMLISVEQDLLGFFPGMLSNAEPMVDVAVIISGGDPMSAISFLGGTPTTLRITSASAYVNYTAGKDATGTPGNDTANFGVQAISIIGGVETTVGTGSVTILPTSSSFIQVTANLTYTDTVHLVSLVRFFFTSGGSATLDSSTLYVDDVSMIGVPQIAGVSTTNANSNPVKVYPNPASGTINLNGPQNTAYTYELSSVNGQVVATKAFKGQAAVNVASLPAGLYFYNIVDAAGNKVQAGKINVSH